MSIKESMNISDYQSLAERTMQFGLSDYDRTIHSTCMLGSEVGEVQSLFQKQLQGHELDLDKLTDELGDVLFSVCEVASFNGIDMGDVAKHNINKLIKRYPHGFEKARSVNRNNDI